MVSLPGLLYFSYQPPTSTKHVLFWRAQVAEHRRSDEPLNNSESKKDKSEKKGRKKSEDKFDQGVKSLW